MTELRLLTTTHLHFGDVNNCYIFITSDFTSHLEILSINFLVLVFVHSLVLSTELYLTIIPRARMSSESDSEAMRARGITVFSEVSLVDQKNRDKTTLAS